MSSWISGVLTVLILETILVMYLIQLLTQKDKVLKPSLGERPSDSSVLLGPKEEEDPDQIWPEKVVQHLTHMLTPTSEDSLTPILKPGGQKSAVKADLASILTGVVQNDGSIKTGEMYTIVSGATEPCHWVNVLLSRFFLILRGSLLFKNRWAERISTKMNSKLTGNTFVSHIQMSDVRLGEHPPKIHGLRVLKGISTDLAVLLEADVTYEGGANVLISTTITGGVVIPVRVLVNAFSGKIRIRVPSVLWPDMYAIAFVEDPGLSFDVHVQTESDMLRGTVNKILSTIMRKSFLEMWVLPTWRTFFFPQLQPSLEEIRVRDEQAVEKLELVKQKQTLVTRATNLWEARGSLLKPVKTPSPADALESSCFKMDSIVSGETPQAEEMEESLVSSFLKIVTEHSESTAETEEGSTLSPPPELIDPKSRPSSPSKINPWKTIRSKAGIVIQKMRVMPIREQPPGELLRAQVNIQCDAGRVYSVLSNPEHFRHVHDTYLGSEMLHEYDEQKGIRILSFQIGRPHQSALVFEVRKRLSPDHAEKYVVVSRSIKEFQGTAIGQDGLVQEKNAKGELEKPAKGDGQVKGETLKETLKEEDDSEKTKASIDSERKSVDAVEIKRPHTPNPNEEGEPEVSGSPSTSRHWMTARTHKPEMYVFGYHIEPNPLDPVNQSVVTIVSQLSSNLSRLEYDYAGCRRLKQFIEELTQLTKMEESLNDVGSDLRRRRIFSFGNDSSGNVNINEPKRIDKLKNYLGTTATYLMKGRKGVSWLGKPNEEVEEARRETELGLLDLVGGKPEEKPLESLTPTRRSEEILSAHSSPSSMGDLTLIKPRRSLSEELSEFEREPYIERLLPIKDHIRVEMPFNRSSYGPDVVLDWEFMCRSEGPLQFMILYNPDKIQTLQPLTQVLPLQTSTTSTRVLFPSSQLQSYTHPSFGMIPLSELDSGVLTLIWTNPPSQAKKLNRKLAYKCLIHNLLFPSPIKTIPPWLTFAEWTVSRKGYQSFTQLLDHAILNLASSNHMSVNLVWEYSTGGLDIQFGICFQELEVREKEEKESSIEFVEVSVPTSAPESIENSNEELKPLLSNPNVNPVPIPTSSDPSSSLTPSLSPETHSLLGSTFRASANSAASFLRERVASNSTSTNSIRSTVADKLAKLAASHGVAPSNIVSIRNPLGLVATDEFGFSNIGRREWIVPLSKVNSGKGDLRASVPLTRSGCYHFVFDNTASFVTGRQVPFRIGLQLEHELE